MTWVVCEARYTCQRPETGRGASTAFRQRLADLGNLALCRGRGLSNGFNGQAVKIASPLWCGMTRATHGTQLPALGIPLRQSPSPLHSRGRPAHLPGSGQGGRLRVPRRPDYGRAPRAPGQRRCEFLLPPVPHPVAPPDAVSRSGHDPLLWWLLPAKRLASLAVQACRNRSTADRGALWYGKPYGRRLPSAARVFVNRIPRLNCSAALYARSEPRLSQPR